MAARQRKAKGPKKATRSTSESDAFADDVVARGEAVEKAGRKRKLPPGVTHEIVGEDAQGGPKLRRRRFSTT